MDGFTYHNIFETKGIEYLAIIIFFLILVPFWIFLNKKSGINQKIKSTLGVLTASAIKIPQGVFFSRNHTWAFLEKKGTAKVGVDDMIIQLTGRVKFEKVIDEGMTVQKGDELATFSSSGKSLKIFSPISGTVTEKNNVLFEYPETVTEDPYNSGWVCRIKPFKWVEETNSYYLAEKANEWTTKEMERFRDFLSGAISKYSGDPEKVILQTGGELREKPLSDQPAAIWSDFQNQFLDYK
ncbi:MAG TPA: glycine cleavage system protein H [Lentimicrobium sp.]|nr:glycine cleavage system protein H [Lentimicrobium sp.]